MSPAGPPQALVTLQLRTRSAAATLALAESLGQALRPGVAGGLVLALEGDLGAGKTLFVRGLARGLGLNPRVAVPSPTFVLAQHFDLPGGAELEHVDAYRLGGVAELEAAGLEDLCGLGRVTCVEWAGRVAEALPEDRIEVELSPCATDDSRPSPDAAASVNGPGEVRNLCLRALGPRSAALLAGWTVPSLGEGA